MTHRARGEQCFVDLVFLHQPPPQRQLVFRGLPIHAEDILTRSEKAFRLAVALQAPFHEERLRLPHQRHLIDSAMAGDAANALLHMDAVVEVRRTQAGCGLCVQGIALFVRKLSRTGASMGLSDQIWE